jgi:molybdopterin/thiamine biosynthesis adenylyltransferase
MFVEKLNQKAGVSKESEHNYTPVFFRINNKAEKDKLEQLVNSGESIRVFNTISSQLQELIKSRNPSRNLSRQEIDSKIQEHLGGVNPAEYGVWVYYPWSDRLVHLLDEHEFIELRTNRNKYKITEEEQQVLYQKKIGVIGLSVGQSVALTLSIERTYGELRIADFDDLEITNLNRLRSGVHNMGLQKTVLVAREIAEIDPFLKVTCFHEGITDDNIESFLLDNGKLDVVIDECDSVDIKIKSRMAAKKHRIPVLMEASDRATIDIERFDLEPERPILHGYVEHLDISKVKDLKTMEEKLPYILPIVGIETMSARLKASAVEVGQSISTWPQLASAVTMGGGITADICRRVLLSHLHISGRFFIDIEELIADPHEEAPATVQVSHQDVSPMTPERMAAIAAELPAPAAEGLITDEKMIGQLVAAARLAPSAGNNQPWKWYFDGRRLLLFDDPSRSAAFANFRNILTNISMGTALENVQLKAKELRVDLDIQLFPSGKDEVVVAAISVRQPKKDIVRDDLVDYLDTRYTNRRIGLGGKIAGSVIDELKRSVTGIGNITFKIFDDKETIKKVADIAGKSEKLRMFIEQGHADLFEREIRWSTQKPEDIKDGLDIRTLDLSLKDQVGFSVIKDPRAIKLVSEWNGGAALENMTRNLVDSSSAVCLISATEFKPENCINVGRAAERAWLVAARHKISFQPVLAPVLHFALLKHAEGGGMPLNIQKEFAKLYDEFIRLFNLHPVSEEPLFLFRLCFAEEPEVKSLRLDIDNIYFHQNT